MSVEKSKKIEELSARIELLHKNEEKLLLKQDLKTQKLRQWILAGMVIIGFLISALIIVILILKRKNLLLFKAKSEKEKQLADIAMEKLQVDQKSKEDELEKSKIEVQMKEQELMYQTLLRLDLTQVNRSVQEKLLPFQFKFPSKAHQNEFLLALREITRNSETDPLADFEFMFNQLHKSFIDNLMVRCSTLSRVELQVCSLLRINLSTKDIARLLNISVGSVDMCRHRVRQKLGLEQTDNLTTFLTTL
jgi:DNA-binding CsgD family transcriptional regulator